MQTMSNGWGRRCRLGVSALVIASLIGPPALAQKGDATLNACSAERDPLVKLDTDYEQMKRSKTAKAVGEGIKQGAMVLAKGVMSGGIPMGRGGGFGGGFGGVGGLVGAVGGMAASQAAAQQARQAGVPSAAAPATASMLFGQDMLSGAVGLSVPGISYGGYGGASFGGGGDMKAYAALAVLVAIVATAEAYAQLKEQEAGGDLKKASYNIDQDAARQVAVARQIADSGSALVECRSRQLNDINTRLAGASNDKDRKAIRRERTQLTSALNKDIDLTGDVVNQHVGLAKTFTQGRAMADGSSEAEVLGAQKPAYAEAPATTKLSMPKGGQPAQTQQAAAAPPPPPPPQALVVLRPAVVRSAPSSTASSLMNLPVGREITPKGRASGDNTWWEIDVAGQPGYLRVTELGDRSMLPAQPATPAGKAGGRGRGGGQQAAAPPPPPPPAVVGPSNIRAYNGQVIAAKTNGKDRLSALMTDIQAAQRRESVFYALLGRMGLG